MPSKDLYLSVIDQSIIRAHIPILITFPFPNIDNVGTAIATLTNGLQATISEFPFLAGTINLADPVTKKLSVRYHDPPPSVSDSGIFSIDYSSVNNRNFDYDDLKIAGMPLSRLPPSVYRMPLLRSNQTLEVVSSAGEEPVMRALATFVPSGLMISVWIHHSVVDGMGAGIVLKRWAENVKKRVIRDHDCNLMGRGPSMSRHALDGLATQAAVSRPFPYCPEFRSGDNIVYEPRGDRLGTVKSKIFSFGFVRLSVLRNALQSTTKSRISMFVGLAALLWTYGVRARKPRLASSKRMSTILGIAADHRTRLGSPYTENYTGNLALYTTSTRPLQSILDPNVPIKDILPEVASAIHDSLQLLTKEWVMDRLAYISSISDPTSLHPNLDLGGSDFFITSWERFGADLVWNIPGTPWSKWEFFRRPSKPRVGGFVVLPRRKDGGRDYEVLVHMVDEDLAMFEEGLQRDGWVERVVD